MDGDRERIPYEADAYLNQLSHYYTDNDIQMARDTFDWLMKHPTWPTEWAHHMIFMAYADWMHTGDKQWLEARIDSLKSKLLLKRLGPNGLITSTKKHIKQGDIVIPMFWQMGRCTELWGNDCLTFDPQRFYQLKQEPSPFKFVAFQAGPRTCLGKRMAIIEMKVLLFTLIKYYKWNIIPNQVVKYRTALTLPMQNPLKFSIQSRT